MLTANKFEPIVHEPTYGQIRQGAVSNAPASPEIRPLTALRFLPALGLVFYHSREYFADLSHLGGSFNFGNAIEFFFVLSGFVLTYNYFQIKDIKAVLYFYLARFARMWPAHAFSLVLLVMLVPQIFKIKGALVAPFFCNLALVHAWIPSWKYFFSFNAPSWSNSTEIFFYLCFPVLLWGLKKNWCLPLLGASLTLAVMIFVCNWFNLPEFDPIAWSQQGFLYVHPLSRMFEFAIGMAAALAFRTYRDRMPLGTMAFTALEMFCLSLVYVLNVNSTHWRMMSAPYVTEAGGYWLQNSGFPVIAMALTIFVFAADRGLIARLLRLPALVLLGEISFAMYMLHGVFLAFRGVNFPQEQSNMAAVLYLLTVLVSSHVMWLLIERPLRKAILWLGSALMPFKCDEETKPMAMRNASINSRKDKLPKFNLALIAGELMLLTGLIYFGLPTIHTIAYAQYKGLARQWGKCDVTFGSQLACRIASARLLGDDLSMTLVWQSLGQQFVDYLVRIQIQDNNGNILQQTDYMQDAHHHFVRHGVLWQDKFNIHLNGAQSARKVLVQVFQARKELLAHGVESSFPGGRFALQVLKDSNPRDDRI